MFKRFLGFLIEFIFCFIFFAIDLIPVIYFTLKFNLDVLRMFILLFIENIIILDTIHIYLKEYNEIFIVTIIKFIIRKLKKK